ncbi:MAG: OsmC family protein [Salibaculum sp.]|jgi:organic hydroperoxide reductase OsmC/OhrA|uniref:OsmC family protein n=1 Tax=Roseovarius halophilus (ex Wu et al. 2025) TaxID=3376060 RepID=UPI00286FB1EE|nr:OsmC family protein [Salibaculum sp.]MDR9426606.1 OsmC family protein [Salibaculum sp.]MDR9481267.1 OsmC family protein [Salibaculum sp.]
MSDLAIELHWQRAEPALQTGRFSNAHAVQYNRTHEVQVDAAPDWGGDPDHTNPEQALAAALSSCHMMTFLALCAKAGWPVASYYDHAEAHLGKTASGKMAVTRIDLNPVVRFDTGFDVAPEKLDEMQHRAHRYCFIANTLAESVQINVTRGPRAGQAA